MKLFFQKILMVLLSVGLVACASSRTKTFQDEGSVPPMLIPANYSSENVDSYYRIPNLPAHNQATGKPVNLVPPGAHKH